ncbi:hypothetical protein A3H40_03335 [Candidatus Daviesbacteria bacterium RIFCSPLOWO2_02_FULL_38_15]|uniref:Uncharacterized protein n=1 Tax=Candidatus Daviesbacteria bacterium RIFCSPLOWO2_02_FULL_38_15 TaxID=1797794 RepID=A0A1F5N3B2_9BACT|nr:MAG: hypothetical protein A3H40_03335 [Candidatus Daviesbacteria bacterium RIFCSPLOWO2_02_FULL_38_15]
MDRIYHPPIISYLIVLVKSIWGYYSRGFSRACPSVGAALALTACARVPEVLPTVVAVSNGLGKAPMH